MDRELVKLDPRRIDGELQLRRLAGHHSVSDWDFSTDQWTLDNTIFLSPPSSLKILSEWPMAVLKHAVSGPITEGRIVDNMRFYRGAMNILFYTYPFRCQFADGDWLPKTFYYMCLRSHTTVIGGPLTRANLRCFDDAVLVLNEEKTINPTLAGETWHKLRLTWWVSEEVLIVRLEKYIDPDWVQLCDDFVDVANRWYMSGVNRVGVGSAGTYTPDYTWHEDTEIWIRVP